METRLNLLCDAGVIDKDICKGMMQVVNVLKQSAIYRRAVSKERWR